VLDEGVAWIMTDLLKSVVTNGIASSAYVKNVQSGGKTGTTNDQYDIWFDGFTPTYAGSLWIGTDNNIAMASMSGPAAALWGRIMRQIDAACTGSYRDRPSNVINVGGEWYTSGTEKGKSTYIDDEKKKKEEEEAKKKAEEEAQRIAQLIADIDTYMDENGCSLQDACEHYGVTVEYYKSNGGTREEPSPDPPDPSGGGGTTP
ncbi:MAG: hypothetical protein HUJ78_06435, partial [Mogibacterium sp.]|nr:hypothetical protein [Mogibacterium sp.]